VKDSILDVIAKVDDLVHKIYVVDDGCPDGSGDFVKERNQDERVVVLHNPKNLGVGGAVKTGYTQALRDGFEIMIKIDGDDQMDPSLVGLFIDPIISRNAEYTKGSRFNSPDDLNQMPFVRLVGNSALSLINKLVSGYWNIMDPTNGFTAIHASMLEKINITKLENDYFFESDMLFRLGLNRAVVQDIPMASKYADEESNLSITKVLLSFPTRYLSRLKKRIFFQYFLRDFNLGSLFLISGFPMFLFGLTYGSFYWLKALKTSQDTPLGTIMVATLTIILGFQSIIFFLQQDIISTPKNVTIPKTSTEK
jgi:glycosyltransferase involved in cell wall biosynthesis